MSLSQSGRINWLALLALGFAMGCGGSSDPAADPGSGKPETPASGVPVPGVPAPGAPAGENPRVEFKTSLGTFTVVLHRDKVPATVDNFLRYVDNQFYDGTVFHMVVPDYAVVGGLYTEDLQPKTPGMAIRNEAEFGLSNRRGTIAMTREEQVADSARCEFFINLVDNLSLDYAPPEEGVPIWQTIGYCAFGEIEASGMGIIDKMATVRVESRNQMDNVPAEPIVILSVKRL